MNNLIKIEDNIQDKIHTIRGVQVMLDEDLAKLYQVPTKVFNQAIKRNIERFPESFRFQLTQNEYDYILRSQIVTSRLSHGGRRYLPYVFTEQGISMLSAVLKSDIAIRVSIKIIESFVKMRKLLHQNAYIFQKIENIEGKILEHDEKIDKIFKVIESNDIKPIKGIFYNGQIYDAYKFINDLFKSTKKEVYHLGSSLKDLGKKIFAFNKMEFELLKDILNKF